MSDIDPDPQESIICHCSGTTREKIIALVDAGFVTLNDISQKTGACSGCGACEYSVIELLPKYC